MYLLMSAVICFSTISSGHLDQIPVVANFLNRILLEGLSADRFTTTDVYFVNFVQPEYVDLQDAVIEGLKKTTSNFTMFMNARNQFARNRLFLLIAVSLVDTFDNCLNTVLRPTLTDQQLAENSQSVHVVVIVLNFDPVKHQSKKLMTITLGSFKTHQFLLMVSTSSGVRLSTVARNMKIQDLELNSSLYDLFYNRPFKDIPFQNFVAIESPPRVIYSDGRFKGLDVTVFNTIMGHLNISYGIILVSHLDPFVRHQTLVQLFNGIVVIGMVNRGKLLINSTSVMTLPYQDGLCILVPKTQHKHLFYHLLQPLETSSWLLLCGMIFIEAFVSARWPKWFHQNLVLSLFHGSTVKTHRMHRWERFVVVGSAIFVTVLIEAYLAKFIFHMTTYRFEKDPQTVDEFVESPHMLLGSPLSMPIYTALRSILENKVITVSELDFKYDIINQTKYGFILPCMNAKTRLRERAEYDRMVHGTNVRPPFHLIPEKLETHQLVYHFSPYFFHYAQFKMIFDRLFEAGLSECWEKIVERQFYVNPAYEFTDTVVLDMERLHLLWTVYGIGNIVSMLAFIFELIIRRIGKLMSC